MKKTKACFAGRSTQSYVKNSGRQENSAVFLSKTKAKNHFTYQIFKNLKKSLKSTFLGLHSPGQEASTSSAKCMSQQQNLRLFQPFGYFLETPTNRFCSS